MESIIAILIGATLIFRLKGREAISGVLFAVSLLLLVILLRIHISSSLNLNF